MIEPIRSIFEQMGVETELVTAGMTLGGEEGLAMDSQEIKELHSLIEKSFRIELPDHALRRSTTVAQLDALVSSLTAGARASALA